MARPPLIPKFATDNTYPAGSDPWSDNDNKLVPGSSTLASGYVPGDRPPAEEHNYLFNLFQRWAEYSGRGRTQHLEYDFSYLADLSAVQTPITKSQAWDFTDLGGGGTIALTRANIYGYASTFALLSLASGAASGQNATVCNATQGSSAYGPGALVSAGSIYASFDAKLASIANAKNFIGIPWSGNSLVDNVSGTCSMFTCAGAGGNIFAVSQLAGVTTGTSTDTGITGANPHFFEIEVFGAGTAEGAVARYYIDGALIVSHVANLPPNDATAKLACTARATGVTAASALAYFGSPRLDITRWAA